MATIKLKIDCRIEEISVIGRFLLDSMNWRFRANWSSNSAAKWSPLSALNWSTYSAANCAA